MTWNLLRLRSVAVVLSASVSILMFSIPAPAQDISSGAQTIPNTGQQITPLAPVGARFTPLNPGLADYPSWLAGQAVTSVSSPDHNTLLVLTSGYNRVNFTSGPNAGSQNAADSNEYVFVYDISHVVPVQ